MTKQTTKYSAFLILVFTLLSCTGTRGNRSVPDMLVISDGDTLACRILRGGILSTFVLTEEGDSLEIENPSIDKIVVLRSGQDITSRYVDRQAIKVELAKKKALQRRETLESDIAAGRKRESELKRIPVAILDATFLSGQRLPQVRLTILNLSDRKIELVKVRVVCFDAKGNPQSGLKGRDHIFQASSRIPIESGEDFTTTLSLRNHPLAKKARLEIHYLEYADRTWWKGNIASSTK